MPAYAAIPPDDPFAASKGLLDALACELAGPAAAGLTASGLEELLDERGREITRQLLNLTTGASTYLVADSLGSIRGP